MEWTLRIAGALLLGLGLAHGAFTRRFGWDRELQAVSLFTRQVFHVHHFFIGLTVALMGLLCLTCAPELVATRLGRVLAGGMAFFWGCRLLIQWFGYSSELWRGKRFETVIHGLFSLLWAFLTGLFAAVAAA